MLCSWEPIFLRVYAFGLVWTFRLGFLRQLLVCTKMRKGSYTFRLPHRFFVLLCIATVAFTGLLYVLMSPHVVVEKAILQGHTLTTALRVAKQERSKSDVPLLVLFTSFELQPAKEHIYRNTLRNWAQLRPLVKPVLYNDNLNTYWVEVARTWGWTVFPVPRRYRETIPILRHMFLNATATFPATFYGYANGDVLFDESLSFTLSSTLSQPGIRKPFIIGRRANFPIKPDNQLYEPSLVRAAATRREARLFVPDAQDYFVTTRDGFPWYAIPDFVIGRVGYDNWLVTAALRRKDGVVIDVTNTVLCLHQSGDDGNFAGFSAVKHPKVNYDLAGADFKYHLGKTDCAPWETVFNNTIGAVVVRRRPGNVCNLDSS